MLLNQLKEAGVLLHAAPNKPCQKAAPMREQPGAPIQPHASKQPPKRTLQQPTLACSCVNGSKAADQGTFHLRPCSPTSVSLRLMQSSKNLTLPSHRYPTI